MEWKKILIIGGIVIAALSIAGNITGGIGWRKSIRSAAEYRDTANSLSTKLEELSRENIRITELNRKTREELDNIIEYNRRAKIIAGELSTEISRDVTGISEIIESIRRIREKVEELENLQ